VKAVVGERFSELILEVKKPDVEVGDKNFVWPRADDRSRLVGDFAERIALGSLGVDDGGREDIFAPKSES
jgi:hypothetical protein